MSDVGRLELIGGHPVIDFVNTLSATEESPAENLHTYADLLVWAERAEVVGSERAAHLRVQADAHPERARRALAEALGLRTHVDRLLRARLADETPRQSLDAVRDASLGALRHARLDRAAHGYDWTWSESDDDLAGAYWPLAPLAVDLLRSDRLERLRLCVDCRYLFLDLSRNRSRRWCSMNGCGARAKMRRYRRAQSRPDG